jgi:hypothetical protein
VRLAADDSDVDVRNIPAISEGGSVVYEMRLLTVVMLITSAPTLVVRNGSEVRLIVRVSGVAPVKNLGRSRALQVEGEIQNDAKL